MQYTTISDGKPAIYSLGAIRMSGDFDKLAIWVYEPLDGENKSTTDLIISAPANTRKESIQILEELNH